MHDFDKVIPRVATHSTKWNKFGPGVLPMWVADMDLAAPQFILDALQERLAHPILGYTNRPDSLNDAFLKWLAHHFSWQIEEDWVAWMPGVVPGLNLASQSLTGDAAIMIPTPVYHPFLDLAANAGLTEITVPMQVSDTLAGQKWTMDFDALQASITPQTRMLLICNPQNPTGRCYTAQELEQLAVFVDKNDLILLSDEIHCNIVLDPNACHHPIAALVPQIAHRTISLYAATKVYNIPGVSCAAAVIPDAQLRQRFLGARRGLVPGIGPLGFTAAETAFNDRSDWMPALLDYLRGNLALLRESLGTRLCHLDGTYLAWIDVRDQDLDDAEAHFANFGLGISPGAQFGAAGYVRLNFGCPRQTLAEGIRRLSSALT